MWFLTKVWVPWWLLFAWDVAIDNRHHTIQQRGAVGFLVLGYGAAAVITTIVYVCARAIRNMNRSGN